MGRRARSYAGEIKSETFNLTDISAYFRYRKEDRYYITLLKQFKSKFADKYGILKIGIFGSVVRGEQTEKSDLDSQE